MHCTHCNSENIKRFSVVCEEGTSTESFSATSKPVWGTKPFSPLGEQKTQGTRTVKTELAKRCSPPVDPESAILHMAAPPGIILAGYYGFSSGFSWNSFWLGLIVFVAVLASVLLGPVFLWKKFLNGNKSIENYRASLENWKHSWYCAKCGGVTVLK